MISRSPWRSRQTICPPRTNAPLVTSFNRLNQNTGSFRGRSHRNARLVVRVQNGKIVRALVLENTGLGGGVILERVVPVKMVGGDIQHHRNPGMKALDGLQLEAADLQHHPGIVGGTLDEGDRRRSDISADQRLPASGRNNFTRQRGGRGLPVGAGDGDDLAFEKARSQFHLADDGDTQRTRLHQLRNIEGHARTDDDQVLIAEGAFAMLSGLDGDAMIEQQRNLVTELLLRFGVGDGHPRTALFQEQGAGHAGLAQSNHQHAFAFKVHQQSIRHG